MSDITDVIEPGDVNEALRSLATIADSLQLLALLKLSETPGNPAERVRKELATLIAASFARILSRERE